MKYGMKLATLMIGFASAAHSQSNHALSRAQVRALAASCARKVHADTIEAIAKQESAFHPYSLSINYPQSEASGMGYSHAQYVLARQPRTKREAIAWTRWFLNHGHTVSIGLMQVSSQQAAQLGIKDPVQLFEPCLNIASGAVVLQGSYRGQTKTLQGLANAFALYNAGSVRIGVENGYASGVIEKAPPLETELTPANSPFHSSHNPQH